MRAWIVVATLSAFLAACGGAPAASSTPAPTGASAPDKLLYCDHLSAFQKALSDASKGTATVAETAAALKAVQDGFGLGAGNWRADGDAKAQAIVDLTNGMAPDAAAVDSKLSTFVTAIPACP